MSKWEVITGDALDVLRTLPDASVDAVVTDPPYGTDCAAWDHSMPPQAFLDECLRVSRGVVLWFGSASRLLDFGIYTPQPERMLIWAPSFSLARSSKSRIFYRYHPIACWRMPSSQRGGLHSDVLRHRCEGKHWWDHPCTKPVDLMRDIVEALVPEGGTVLDPFGGSGTTAVACVQTGRGCILVEQREDYCDIARRRIAEAVPLCAEAAS